MVDSMKLYKSMTSLDVLLIPAKLKSIQLDCFTNLDSLDWLNNSVYNMMYAAAPNENVLNKEEQAKFERYAQMVLGKDIRRPKFLSFSQWIAQGGSGLKTFWSIYYLDKINKEDKPLIISHFECFHPLCYKPLVDFLLNLTKSSEIILLSTSATALFDIYKDESVTVDYKKFVELKNHDIVSLEDFVCKVLKKDEKYAERPWMYNVEKMYRIYCGANEFDLQDDEESL